jgi:hypothetical protein
LKVTYTISIIFLFFLNSGKVTAINSFGGFSAGNSHDQVSKYPFRFILSDNCGSFVNPAIAGIRSMRELNFGSQQMLGVVSHVSASYFTFHLRLQHGRMNKPYSSVGAILYNDREGKYLSRSRFYGSYAWHASLSRKFFFSAGLSVGGMNYSVKGTPLSGDGSDTKADGAVGISVYSNTFRVDMSVAQVFNSKVQPLEEVTVLSPVFTIGAYKSIRFDDEFLLVPAASVRIPIYKTGSDNIGFTYDYSLQAEWRDRFIFSTGIHIKSLLFFAAGIDNLSFYSGHFGIMVSYAFPAFRKSVLKTRLGEAGIRYYF